ncbi:unnamed protein product, partial [Porites lobata]
ISIHRLNEIHGKCFEKMFVSMQCCVMPYTNHLSKQQQVWPKKQHLCFKTTAAKALQCFYVFLSPV